MVLFFIFVLILILNRTRHSFFTFSGICAIHDAKMARPPAFFSDRYHNGQISLNYFIPIGLI